MNTNGPLDRYISVSQQDVNRLLERGIPGEDIDLVYNAVDLSGLQIGGDREWLRERFGLPTDSIVAAAVGRLVWQKNHEMLIKAMKKAVAEVPWLVAVIIGTGELKAELEDQIRSLHLEKNVLLAGYLDRNEVLKVVKSSDMYVMPSRYEGTPIALLEAAFLGRPILATYAGGIPELVSDPEHALLFQPDDSEGMATGMVKIARDSGFAQALAERGQQHVREVFSLERQVQATWNAYQKAWARHQSHHPRG
jgi:glycosyltransferase involved in cell wall biosynthesis